MKRREFIGRMAVTTGAMVMGPVLVEAVPGGGVSPQVVQVTGADPGSITRRAVAEMGGMKKFVSRGDVVMIKPNIGWNRNVSQGACTHPEVVRSLVELVLAAGARKVIVMDNPCHRPEDTYQRSGIAEAARKAGAEVRFPDENRIVSFDFKGEVVTRWPVFRDFLEVDKFINVPVLKHHGSSGLTIAMKNLFGICGGNRGKLHRDMGEGIADLNAGFKTHLVLVDATRILRRNGPVGGAVSDVDWKNTVFAAESPFLADVVAAGFFGRPPQELEFLTAGAARGMGPLDPTKIRQRALTV